MRQKSVKKTRLVKNLRIKTQLRAGSSSGCYLEFAQAFVTNNYSDWNRFAHCCANDTLCTYRGEE
jgi:hypothetical protein